MWNKDANVEKYKIEQNDVELIRISSQSLKSIYQYLQ